MTAPSLAGASRRVGFGRRLAFTFAFFGFSAVAFAEISLSPNTANIAAAGGPGSSQVINSGTPVSWTAASSDGWLTITSGSTGTGNGNISYSAAGNPSAAGRTATITVTPSSGAARTLVVSQLGGQLNISPSSANAQPTGDSGAITVNSTDPSLQWVAASSDNTWLTVTAGGTGIGPASVQWAAAANTTPNTRTAIITVSPLDGTGNTFAVTQQGQTINGSISISPSSLNIDAAGGSGSLQVISAGQPLSWTAKSGDAWLTVPAGTSGTGNGPIPYTGAPNPAATTRTATITVTPSQGSVATISVTESGGVLVVSPPSSTVPASGGGDSISLTTTDSALQWTAVSSQTWVTITGGKSGAGPGAVTWTAAANTANLARSATITITPFRGTGQVVTINQSAPIVGTLSLNPASAPVPASISVGSTQVISTDSGLKWTAASSDSWLTITSGAAGTGNGTIQYSAVGNPSAAPRTATITASPTNGTAPATLSVTQAGGVLTLSATSGNAPAAGGTNAFSITTNNTTLQWTALSSDPWLTFTATETPTKLLYAAGVSGVADASVNWAASANASSVSRTATITVTPAGGTPQSYTVTQSGLTGTLVPGVPSLSFSYQLLGVVPGDAQITIGSSPAGLPFTATASTTSGGAWLTVSGTGPSPAVLTVSVNPAGLVPGTYSGTITLNSAAATNAPVAIPVTLTVSPSPVSDAAAAERSEFLVPAANGPLPSAQTFSILTGGSVGPNNKDTGPLIDYSIVPDPTAPWFTASGAGPAPANITVTVTPQSLQPGSYQGTITLNAPGAGNNPLTVPVTLRVSSAPTLLASPAGLSLTLHQLDPIPSPVALSVTSTGTDLSFTTSTTASWLTISGGGQTPFSPLVSINPDGMSPGIYQAAVVLSSTSAANSTLPVPVTLTLLAGPSLTAQPNNVALGLTQGSAGTATTSVTLNSDSPVAFSVNAQTSSGGNWLSVLSSGTSTPSVFTVTAAAGNLAPGVYSGAIVVTSSQAVNGSITIPVTLTISVQPQLTVSPGQLTFAYQLLSGPAALPSQALTVQASDASTSSVAASATTSTGGNWLSVTSGGATPAALRVSVDATGLGAGTYNGTVILTSTGYAPATIPVTLRVTSAALLSTGPTSLSFSHQQGSATPPPAQSLTVTGSSGALLFAATGDGNTWLTVTGGATTPGSISVAVNPAGLGPGTYAATVALSSTQAGNSPFAIPVTLTIAAGPSVLAQPSSLAFTYTQLGSVPPTQSVSLSSAQSLNIATSISPTESWLVVTSPSAATPASLQVSIDPTGLTPGQYNASILVNAPGAANNPIAIPVSLTVNSAPTITPSLPQVTFSYQVSGAAPANQPFVVTGSDPSLMVTAAAGTSSGGGWLSVMGGGSVPAAFSLSADPTGLSPGIYNGTITLTASSANNSPLTLPVTLVVSAAPNLSASINQLALAYQIGGSVPAIAPIQITSGGTSLQFQATAATVSGGAWLQVSSGGPTPGLITPTMDPSGLAPGTYTGSIALSSASAGNSPLLVPVSLTVSSSLTLTASPASVQFIGQQNGATPAPQTVQITAGVTAIAVTYSNSPGAQWLTVNGSGTTPSALSVSVSTAGLLPGRYAALVLAQSALAANSPLEIPVTLDVSAAPVLQTSSPVLRFAYVLSGVKPSPQTFSVSSSGGPLSYSASVLVSPGSTWLFSSGSGETPGSVQVAVDPGVLTAGDYTGTVVVSSPDAVSPALVTVVLSVTNAPVINVQPTRMSFTYQVNGPVPAAQSAVVRSDSDPVNVLPVPLTFRGGNWLTVAGGGTTPATFSIATIPAGLAPGSYNAEVLLGSSSASNSPIAVIVTLTVTTAPVIDTAPNVLAFTAQAGGVAAANRQITVTTSDGSAAAVTAQPSSGISWLSVSSDSSTTPALFTVSANPGSLSPGLYLGSIVFTSSTAGSQTVPVNFTVTSQPSLSVSPPNVVFGAAPGASSPPPFMIAVNGSTPLDFVATPGPGAPWLFVTGSGTTPSQIGISVNQTGLSPGFYHGAVFITAAGAGNSPLGIPVDFIVSSAPLVTTSPNALSFTGSGPATQSFTISSTGSTSGISISASAATPWLHASIAGVTVTVSVDPTGLAPGNYQGAVQIIVPGAANSPVSVPITLQVPQTPSLQANPSPLSFAYNSSGPLPQSQRVALTFGGAPASASQATVAPGTPWLSATSTSDTVSVGVNPTGLFPGSYTGSVQIAAAGASNSPLTIPVNFTVTGLPSVDVSQDAVALAALPAQSQPVSTMLAVGAGSNIPVKIDANVTASTWLSVTPTSGTTPYNVTITADPTGLRAGNYAGSIALSSQGNPIRTIPVNLTITSQPTLSVAPEFLTFTYYHGGDVPRSVNLYFLRFLTDFSITPSASDPWILLNPSTPTASGPVAVTVQPAGLAPGVYHGSVSLTVPDNSVGPVGFVKQIPVELYVDQPANPRISGVVSGMSLLPAQIAPGLIFSIFGSGMGPSMPVTAQVQPDQTLAQSLGGVQVLVNGIFCPLLYVSDGQINAIAPYALYMKDSATVEVHYNGVSSNAVPVDASPTSPGIFSQSSGGSGPGAILNEDHSLNTSANPAAKGTIISLFGGGEGQTTPQGIDGLIAPTGPISSLPQPILPIAVSIGGIPATDITYAGAAPQETAGLLQINVRIPANAPSGEVPVVIQIGQAISQGRLTVSVR